MTKRTKKKSEETLVDLVEAREHAQDFFERNQNLIFGITVLVVIIIGGYFVYQNLYKKPRNERAMAQMSQAQIQFERDSFALALESPGGGFEGFIDIIDNYGGTKASNLSKYYAGICYLRLGRYDSAVEYLKKFDPEGSVTPIMKHGALGDAYSEQEDWDNAIAQYRKAINTEENNFLTPYYMKKLALLHEFRGNVEASLELYTEIKVKYPESTAGRDIDKYIARLEAN